MIDSKKLVEQRATSAAIIKKMATVHAKLMSYIDDVKADDTLTKDQQRALIKREREKHTPAMIEGAQQVRAIAEQAAQQERFWDSKAFVLSQSKFSDVPSSDATIKLWKSQQLASMPTPLLSLTFEHAKTSGDFATMALCLNARDGRKVKFGELNSAEFSLDGVDLPGRTEALAAIKTLLTDRNASENYFSEVAGLRNNPVDRMAIARERVAAEKQSLGIDPNKVVQEQIGAPAA